MSQGKYPYHSKPGLNFKFFLFAVQSTAVLSHYVTLLFFLFSEKIHPFLVICFPLSHDYSLEYIMQILSNYISKYSHFLHIFLFKSLPFKFRKFQGRVYEPEVIEHIRTQGPLSQHKQGSYELTETYALCTGPAWFYTRSSVDMASSLVVLWDE